MALQDVTDSNDPLITESTLRTIKAPPQLFLPTIYGLNKSFSKKVYIGIEVGLDGIGQVAVRLTGNDFAGVAFSVKGWEQLLATFPRVSKFFSTGRDHLDLLDQKITGREFSVRFVICHRDKAVEIQEEISCKNDDGPPAAKKYKQSIVMKSSTFAILQKYVEVIGARIAELEKKLPDWNRLMREIGSRRDNPFNSDEARECFGGDPMLLQEIMEVDFPMLTKTEIFTIYKEMLFLKFVSNNFMLDVSACV